MVSSVVLGPKRYLNGILLVEYLSNVDDINERGIGAIIYNLQFSIESLC